MKILRRKLIISLFFLQTILSHPIYYEEVKKEKSPVKIFKSSKSGYLNIQQQNRNINGKEELMTYGPSKAHSEQDNSKKPFYNKFNRIPKYYKYHQKSQYGPAEVNQKVSHSDQHYTKGDYIPDHYIVLFKKNIEDYTIFQHMDRVKTLVKISNKENKVDEKNEIKHIYNIDGFKGYHGKFDETTLKIIRESSEVFTIERDQKIKINNLNVQTNAPWNLSRISRRQFIENEINKEKYLYQHSSGQNVTVYVVDTGINIHHVEFSGRAKWGGTFSDEIENEDLNGHGTHVAGIIGGTIYGVAKKVNLVAVKVINKNGEGSLSGLIQGIEFSIKDHDNRKKANTSVYPVRSIINFSLGGPLSVVLNRAVDTAVRYGMNIVTAAGNEKSDACNTSPASSDNVITVASTNNNDEMSDFSNIGNCVNVFAPGDMIESAWIGSTNNLINTLSGTSMACPHVSGVVALLLDTEKYANYTPEKVISLIENLSTKNIIKKIPISNTTTPNRFIYSSPPVQGTEYSDNDKTNDNDPDNLDDIVDDDDKPDDLDDIVDDDDGKDNNDKDNNKGDDGVGDIIDDDDDKPDDLGDIIDDDDDKPDDLGDIIDDDDDKPDDLGDIIDDDDKPDDLGDIIDDDDKPDDGVGDIIDDDDKNNNDNKGDDGVGDIIDDDDKNNNDNKGDDGIGDIIDDNDNDDSDDNNDPDDIGDIIDDDNDDNDGLDGIEEEEDHKDQDNDGLNDIIEDDDEDPDRIDDIIENGINSKEFYINRGPNDMNNTFKVRKPLRKDKTYIRYYHYKQIQKEYNIKKIKNY